MVVIGVTGSRTIETERQRRHVIDVIDHYVTPRDWLIHGACVGVDELCAKCAWDNDAAVIMAVVPPNRSLVSEKAVSLSGLVEDIAPGPNGYKRRNQTIVDESDRILAFPGYPEDHPKSRRSGTWQTIRMARRAGIPVRVYVLSEVGE